MSYKQLLDIPGAVDQVSPLPAINWDVVEAYLDSCVAPDDQPMHYSSLIADWLGLIASQLEAEHCVVRSSDNFYLLGPVEENPDRLLRWAEHARDQVIEMADAEDYGLLEWPMPILIFGLESTLVDYIATHDPDAELLAGRMFNEPLPHIVTLPDMAELDMAYYLAHALLATRTPPAWLAVGFALMMQSVTCDVALYSVDDAIMSRHRECWQRHGLDYFISGACFAGDDADLGQHLAETAMRILLADYPKAHVSAFILAADQSDGGDAAARQHLGIPVKELLEQVSGSYGTHNG